MFMSNWARNKKIYIYIKDKLLQIFLGELICQLVGNLVVILYVDKTRWGISILLSVCLYIFIHNICQLILCSTTVSFLLSVKFKPPMHKVLQHYGFYCFSVSSAFELEDVLFEQLWLTGHWTKTQRFWVGFLPQPWAFVHYLCY